MILLNILPPDFHFANPQAGYLFLLLFLFAVLGWGYQQWRSRALSAFGEERSVKQLLFSHRSGVVSLRLGLFAVAWIAGTIALAQPQGNGRLPSDSALPADKEVVEEEVREVEDQEPATVIRRYKSHEVVFLLDTSYSMSVADTRTGATRLEYAKEIVDEVMKRLDGESVALYGFTSELTTLVPSTTDYLFTRFMTRDVGYNSGDVAGTDLFEALEGWKARHLGERRAQLKTLILLTDGGDTRLERLEGEEREREVATLVERLGDTQKAHLRVFTVGLGTQAGEWIPDLTFEGEPVRSSLDEQTLVTLSQKGNGRYYFANSFTAPSIAEDIFKVVRQDPPIEEEQEVEALFAEVERQIEQKQEEVVYENYFQIPLAVALLALCAEWVVRLLIPVRRFATGAALLLCLVVPGGGFGLLESSRLAETYFEAGDYATARSVFQELLSEKLTVAQKAIIEVNLANVALAAGEFDKAVAQCEQVQLGKQPNLVTARRLHKVWALAYMQLAVVEREGLEEADGDVTERFGKIISSLEEAIIHADLALESDKELVDGEEHPSAVEELRAIRREAKQRLVAIKQLQWEVWLANLQRRSGVALLKGSADRVVAQVEPLIADPNEQTAGFLTGYAAALERERFLWDRVRQLHQEEKEQMEEQGSGETAQENMNLFSDAYNHHLVALDHFREGDAHQGVINQRRSSEILRKLLEEGEQESDESSADEDGEQEQDQGADDDSGEGDDDSPPEEQEQSGESQEQEEQDEERQQLLQLYQQMEKEDRADGDPVQVRQGLRPW